MSIYLQTASLMRRVEGTYQEALRRAGRGDLNPLELHILLSLYRQDGQRASDLAKSIGRAATSFTPVLDRLAEFGYLCRKADADDRRSVGIFLTAKGEALREPLTMLADALDKELALAIAAPV